MSSRFLRRAAVLVLAVLTAVVGLATAAAAHVTVSSADAAPGGYGKLVFRVPNESDTASTVALRIQIPEAAAMGSLRVQPLPGWTATLTTLDLEEPIEVHGREISSYVSVVEFRAEDGGGIRPGEFQEFALSGGPFPDADEVVYPTVQTYSDGTESAWIEPTVEGQDEPERPAPTLALTGTAGGHGSDQTDVDTASEATAADDDGSGSATAALWLSIAALVVAVAGVVLAVTGRRRTVSA